MKRNTIKTLAVVAVLATTGLSRAELVGSFLFQGEPTPDGVESFSDIVTRTTSGNAGTQGAVAGTVDAVAGSVLGAGSYGGIIGTRYSGASAFFDVNRYGTLGGLVAYDYDFSTYLSTHAAGTAIGQYTYALDIDLSNRAASDGADLAFLISYSNGSGLSLDTSDIVLLGAGNNSAFDSLAADTSKYVAIGTNPANTESAVYSWDITSLIAASTDGKIRVLFHDDGEYKGDIVVNNASGIASTEVIPEPATMGLVSLVALAALFVRRLAI